MEVPPGSPGRTPAAGRQDDRQVAGNRLSTEEKNCQKKDGQDPCTLEMQEPSEVLAGKVQGQDLKGLRSKQRLDCLQGKTVSFTLQSRGSGDWKRCLQRMGFLVFPKIPGRLGQVGHASPVKEAETMSGTWQNLLLRHDPAFIRQYIKRKFDLTRRELRFMIVPRINMSNCVFDSFHTFTGYNPVNG